MYLKSIEVQGFKSFANKIRFEFHNGITGIVGPNGSGKSNVADAVRWVLGEQRIKQLRGASMQDVIFSGTEMRKPLGYAYVAITLDNADRQLPVDYDEVTVARKIYRSGESEYLMNGNVCRLKDVNELFYDTGIGKEGYSIIGQGQIDRILSGKPEERRELFDEAAGIVKYKKRKAAAVKQLEEEKQNLTRVNDILSELEKQVGPLEKQSEKAHEYLRKKEELKRLDVNHFLQESERKNSVIAETKEKRKIVNDDLEEHRAKLEGIKTEYTAVEEEIAQLEQQLEEARSNLSDAGSTRTKLEGQIELFKEQIRSAQAGMEHFAKRIEDLKEQLAEKEKEKENIDSGKDAVDEVLAEAQAKRDRERALLNEIQERIESMTASIEADKNTIIQLLNERANVRSSKERYDTMLEQSQVRRAELNSRFLQAKTDEEEQRNIIAGLEKEFEDINKRIAELDLEQKKKEERTGEIHDELAEIDRKLQETRVSYHQDKTKLESISNMTERYEGYGNSIRRVMEKKTEDAGVIGVVADIIRVEKKYEVAIETALGGNIQNIVTKDEATAKRMIAFLKENRFGRATFLPLTSISHPQEFKTPEVLSEKGVVGMANEIVTTDPEYENVAKSMLGRIVVVDNVDHALAIAKKFDYGIRMVTIEGELLVPGGAISGGAFKNNSNLLSRRREMDELEKKVREAHKKINAYLDEIEKIKGERNKLRMEIEDVKYESQQQFIRLNTANLNLQKAKEKIEETARGVGDLNSEQSEIETQVKDIKEKQEEIEEILRNSSGSEKETRERIDEVQEKLDAERDKESAQAMVVTECEVELEKLLQKQEFEAQSVERIDSEIARIAKEMQEAEESSKNNEQTVKERENDIEEITKTIAASFTAEEDSRSKLSELQEKKESLAEKQKSFFGQREELSDKISGLDKEAYRLSNLLDKLQDEMNGLYDYMWTEYELTLEDAAALKDETLTDLVFIKRSIAEVKDGIKRLGDVNVNAIEDYKAVMERYTFLKGQHDDLIEAEKELQGIITELDEAMRKQFTEKFAEIGREFDKVFKELFGGGTGTLKLMEDEDILEAGIQINAQPPGKKLGNMMQLSGGEKALAAIALLFAIQNLKPSPFCLLDEIEAALDESNVERYAKYLHKLTAHTQFIVITHRRGTMEKADRLYGITMQEKGVSTLVSVNLIDEQLAD
ncbi:MAG: chromosome segregation protein SMC [Lachnospiraceae bacterium]|nr:chromosome segregation protein SMC [Lachnospiraceae bacterium]